MIKYLLPFTLLLSSFSTRAQTSVGFSFGGNFSQVRFTDSNGNLNKNLKGLPGSTASIYYLFDLVKGKKLKNAATNYLGVEAGYKSSKFEDVANNLITSWQIQYLSAQFLFRHATNSLRKANLFYGGGFVTDFQIAGTQNQGFSQYDITEDLKPINLSITAEAGIKYDVSDDAAATLRFSYLRGLTNVEKDESQTAFIHSVGISAAVFFYLTRTKKK